MCSDDWRQQECAVLAIGAVAPGCYKAMSDSGAASGIFMYLVQALQKPRQHFLVVSIVCWAISRISSNFVTDNCSLLTVLNAVCHHLANDNMKVSSSADFQ
jgi:hypothetical protein